MKIPDKMRCGDSIGNLVEVFNPRWYRIDRWIAWWTAKKRARSTVVISFMGKSKTYRCIKLPFEARGGAFVITGHDPRRVL